MKPDVSRMLDVAAAHLMTRVAPALGPGYEQSSLLVLMMLLTSAREEFERAAARRVEENREMRLIFADAVPLVHDTPLRSRLQAAAASEDPSLAITELELSNSALRGLLIDLHAHVEALDSKDARAIEARIWRELAASTERRRLVIAPY